MKEHTFPIGIFSHPSSNKLALLFKIYHGIFNFHIILAICVVEDANIWTFRFEFNEAKWTFFLSLCASRITSFLVLIFPKTCFGNVSSFFHSLSTAAFVSGVHQIMMCHKCDLLSRGFMRFHCTTIHCFELFLFATVHHHFRDCRMLFVHPFSWHGWCHRSFQFSFLRLC